jgi:hypothetical protein
MSRKRKIEENIMDKNLIANELVDIARELFAMDFPTQDAMDKYLKDHPDADRSNHKVVKHDSSKSETHPMNLMQQRKNEKKMEEIGKHFNKKPENLTNNEIVEYNKIHNAPAKKDLPTKWEKKNDVDFPNGRKTYEYKGGQYTIDVSISGEKDQGHPGSNHVAIHDSKGYVHGGTQVFKTEKEAEEYVEKIKKRLERGDEGKRVYYRE